MNANEYRLHRQTTAKNPARTCPACGKEHHKRTVLCASCYRQSPRMGLPVDAASLRGGIDLAQSKVCPVCERVFHKKRATSQTEWDEQTQYCSRACYGKSKALPACTCEQCGQSYRPIGRSWSAARYCSRACLTASQRKPLPLCAMCGETCHKHGRRFCSPECKVAWYRGPAVYNYLGGQAREHYASAFWLERARLVRERDKVCQHCGAESSVGKELHVHHVVPWRISHDDAVENLVTLCPSCHKREDQGLSLDKQ